MDQFIYIRNEWVLTLMKEHLFEYCRLWLILTSYMYMILNIFIIFCIIVNENSQRLFYHYGHRLVSCKHITANWRWVSWDEGKIDKRHATFSGHSRLEDVKKVAEYIVEFTHWNRCNSFLKTTMMKPPFSGRGLTKIRYKNLMLRWQGSTKQSEKHCMAYWTTFVHEALWHENPICITGPLSAETTGHRWIPLTQDLQCRALIVSLKRVLKKHSSCR